MHLYCKRYVIMKNSIVSLLILLVVSSCSSDDVESYDISTFYFTTESRILLTTENEYTYANIEYGENLVFKYEFIKADDPNIQDDEYSERLIFEIDPSLDNFTYNAEDITNAKAYFNQYCFCADTQSIPIVSGTINGTKLGLNDWLVSIDVSFELNGELQSRSINKVFSNRALFRQNY